MSEQENPIRYTRNAFLQEAGKFTLKAAAFTTAGVGIEALGQSTSDALHLGNEISIGTMDPIYNDGNFPRVNTYLIKPENNDTVRYSNYLLDTLIAAGLSIKHLNRRNFLRLGIAVVTASGLEYSLPAFGNSAERSFIEWAIQFLPPPYGLAGTEAVTNLEKLIERGNIYNSQKQLFNERTSSLETTLKTKETVSSGYEIARFSINAPIPIPAFSQLGPHLSNPEVVVGIGPANKVPELFFPTDLTRYEKLVTIAADARLYAEKLSSSGGMIISAGATHNTLNGFAERIVIDFPSSQNNIISKTLSLSIPYGWDNFVEGENPLPIDARHASNVLRTNTAEFRHRETVQLKYQNQVVRYQSQFWIDSGYNYNLHGAQKFAQDLDETLNLVAIAKDKNGNLRTIFVSGNWWWNIRPNETPSLLKALFSNLALTLQSAYCVDTGAQAGFYYLDNKNELQFSDTNNKNHTTVAAIIV